MRDAGLDHEANRYAADIRADRLFCAALSILVPLAGVSLLFLGWLFYEAWR
jgi:hypothetical protein